MAKLVIDLLNQAHVGRHHRVAHRIVGKGPAMAIAGECLIDWMRVVQLGIRTNGRHDLVGVVHVVVGRGYDVRPMRLDVA